MKATNKLIEPHFRWSRRIRWVSTIAIGLFGVYVLFQSHALTGIAMEWRISAGVSALSLFFLSLIEGIAYPPGSNEFLRRWIIGSVFTLAGMLSFKFVYVQKSEWAKNMLLELGVACLFVAAVDFLIGAVCNSAIEHERKESEFYDEGGRYPI